MPIYIYECGDCGTRKDYLVKPDERPSGCEDCGSEDLTRIYEGQTFGGRREDKSGMHQAPFALVVEHKHAQPVTVQFTERSPDGSQRVVAEVPMIRAPVKPVFPRDN